MGKIAVIGLGESWKLFEKDKFDLTIGVNDVWKNVQTDVLVVVDPRHNFTPERLKVIDHSTPVAFYSQIVNWDKRKDFKKINILPGYPDVGCPLRKDGLWKSYCSPFIACQVGYSYYDADEIHLFGVDLLNHPHLDQRLCQLIKKHFKHLKYSIEAAGCKFIVHGNGILSGQL